MEMILQGGHNAVFHERLGVSSHQRNCYGQSAHHNRDRRAADEPGSPARQRNALERLAHI
jgi:hypothetical protein